MRHNVYGKHLGRRNDERSALFKSLVRNLFLYESIETTEAKAKAIKGLVDRIITQAKFPATKRLVKQFLNEKQIEEKLFKEIVPKVQSRNSGYTATIKVGRRLGDGAMVVKMSLLVDTVKSEPKEVKSKKTKEVKEEEK